MRRFRRFPSSRSMRVLAVLAAVTAGVVAVEFLLARRLPETGILVLDLRQSLPDKTVTARDGRRSVSAVDVLRSLDAARNDVRVAGVYLRVGGGGMALAQATEIADAVMRVRAAGKFAVAWSGGFSASNLSDRVLAAAADEIWSKAQTGAGGRLIPPREEIRTPPLSGGQAVLWSNLIKGASQRIALAAEGAAGSVDAVARADGPPPPQLHSGPEARAEQAALAWGGAGAAFVDLLTYREALDRRAGRAPVVAVVQAEGVLDILDGPGVTELAGPLANRIRTAAADPRVKGLIIRVSAVSASDEALALLARAATEARRGGTPAGVSFGFLVPAGAAGVWTEIPVMAPGGALLVDPASAADAAVMVQRARSPWRTGFEGGHAMMPAAEALFLQRGAALAAIGAGGNAAPGTAPEAHSSQPDMWHGDVGTLIELKDRLPAGSGSARPLRMALYEPRKSVWVRTKARFADLWRRLSTWKQKPAAAAAG